MNLASLVGINAYNGGGSSLEKRDFNNIIGNSRNSLVVLNKLNANVKKETGENSKRNYSVK